MKLKRHSRLHTEHSLHCTRSAWDRIHFLQRGLSGAVNFTPLFWLPTSSAAQHQGWLYSTSQPDPEGQQAERARERLRIQPGQLT